VKLPSNVPEVIPALGEVQDSREPWIVTVWVVDIIDNPGAKFMVSYPTHVISADAWVVDAIPSERKMARAAGALNMIDL
jgi:hypothetical protein